MLRILLALVLVVTFIPVPAIAFTAEEAYAEESTAIDISGYEASIGLPIAIENGSLAEYEINFWETTDGATSWYDLDEGIDYEITGYYLDAEKADSVADGSLIAGTKYYLEVSGIGEYEGSLMVETATCAANDINRYHFNVGRVFLTDSASVVAPYVNAFTVKGYHAYLENGVDFEIDSYLSSDGVELDGVPNAVGNYRAVINGIGDYTGTVTRYFSVVDGYDLSSWNTDVSGTALLNGDTITPPEALMICRTDELTGERILLEEGTHYELVQYLDADKQPFDAWAAGTYYAQFEGISPYYGTAYAFFTVVNANDLSLCGINHASRIYSLDDLGVVVRTRDAETGLYDAELTEGVDYEIVFVDGHGCEMAAPTTPGHYHFLVKALGDYEGQTRGDFFLLDSFDISGYDWSMATVSVNEGETPDLQLGITPPVGLFDSTEELAEGEDYEIVGYLNSEGVEVENISESGLFYAVVQGINDYSGTLEVPFGANYGGVFPPDVKIQAWYAEAVMFAVKHDLSFNPEDGSLFRPNDCITRSELATMLWRLSGSPSISGDDPSFTDVDSSAYYFPALKWAISEGVMTGYGFDGRFGPHDELTREQMAAVLARYTASVRGGDVSADTSLDQYMDAAEVSAWASESVAWAVSIGLMGANVQYLYPHYSITRAETVTMIKRLAETLGPVEISQSNFAAFVQLSVPVANGSLGSFGISFSQLIDESWVPVELKEGVDYEIVQYLAEDEATEVVDGSFEVGKTYYAVVQGADLYQGSLNVPITTCAENDINGYYFSAETVYVADGHSTALCIEARDADGNAVAVDFDIVKYIDGAGAEMTDMPTEPGNYQVVLEGAGDFTGSKTIKFQVAEGELLSNWSTDYPGQAYVDDAGNATIPDGWVFWRANADTGENEELVEGEHYRFVRYLDSGMEEVASFAVGDYYAEFEGVVPYMGTALIGFTVEKMKPSVADLEINTNGGDAGAGYKIVESMENIGLTIVDALGSVVKTLTEGVDYLLSIVWGKEPVLESLYDSIYNTIYNTIYVSVYESVYDAAYLDANSVYLGKATITGINDYTGELIVGLKTKSKQQEFAWKDLVINGEPYASGPAAAPVPVSSNGLVGEAIQYGDFVYGVDYTARLVDEDGNVLSSVSDGEGAFLEVVGQGDWAGCKMSYHVFVELTGVAVPGVATGLVYTGLEQTGVLPGEGYVLSGVTSATEAGDYEATATLLEGSVWSDGTTEPKVISWSIAKAVYDMSAVSFDGKLVEYDGALHGLTVDDIDGELPEGLSVSISGTMAKKAGSYKFTAKFAGDANHEPVEDMTATLIIAKARISTAEVLEIEDQYYTGSAVEPDLAVLFNGKPLTEGVDYAVSYANNAEVGTATATVTGKGSFAGQVVVEFAIVSPAPDLKASVGTSRAWSGDTVSVPVSVSGNEGVAAMRLKFSYDESFLTLKDVVASNLIYGASLTVGESADGSSCVYWGKATDVAGDGVIYNLVFEVSPDASVGESVAVEVSYEEGDVCTAAHDNLLVDVSGGVVNVVEFLPGDVYEDGKLDAHDPLLLQQYLTDLADFDARQKVLADVNADGAINMKDLIALAKAIVGTTATTD